MLGGFLFRTSKYRMSGFGTAKVQTNAVRLGFPIAVEDAMARDRFPSAYAPTAHHRANLPQGHDLQALWHEQKRKDAHDMVRAKVKATQMANVRAFSSHNGYYEMPKPVLGQRKYANPSMGNYSDVYSARPNVFSGGSYPAMNLAVKDAGTLEGGVLRTSAGQAYGKARLIARIGQLKAIEEAKQNLVMGEPSTAFTGRPPSEAEQLDSIPQIELAQLLRSIQTGLLGRQRPGYINIKSVYEDSMRAFKLIVQLATTGSEGEMINVLEFIRGGQGQDGILQALTAMIEQMGQGGAFNEDEDEDRQVNGAYNLLNALEQFWSNVITYLTKMAIQSRGGDIPLKDRKTLSKSLIASLKFNSFLGRGARVYLDAIEAQNALEPPPFADEGGDDDDDDDDDEDDDDDDGGDRGVRGGLRRREDAEHGSRRPVAQFSSNARDAWAYSSGQYQDNTGGRGRAFLGEEQADYGEDGEALLADALGEVDGADGINAREMGMAVAGLQPGGLGFPIASRYDSSLGGYDVDTGRASASASSASSASALKERGFLDRAREAVAVSDPRAGFQEPAVGFQRKRTYPYTAEEVPRDLDGIRQFIQRVRREHPEYSQTWYDKESKPKNVRRNTIRKMREAGLMG